MLLKNERNKETINEKMIKINSEQNKVKEKHAKKIGNNENYYYYYFILICYNNGKKEKKNN